jgi:hypothetical protein
MNPRYEEIFKDKLISYDYDENSELITKYNVGTILPVLIIMNKDREVVRIIGEKTNKEIIKILKDNDINV